MGAPLGTLIFLVQEHMEENPEFRIPGRLKFVISRPILRYTGVDNSWTWLSNWRIVKEGHDSPPRYGLSRVWTYQPSLVRPGSIDSKIEHPQVECPRA